MSHELSLRLGELSRGELGWLVGWLKTQNPALVRRGVAVLDTLSAADRQPITTIDSIGPELDT